MTITCRHCGKPPEDDGDHSCPCPYRDDDCPDHPLIVSPITSSPWPENEPLGAPPPWPAICTDDPIWVGQPAPQDGEDDA